jgi:hypothetical protein
MKSDWDLLKVRCEWYSFIIQGKEEEFFAFQNFQIHKPQSFEWMISIVRNVEIDWSLLG